MKSIGIYTNDFFKIKEDEDAIQESISRILITSPGERVNNPTFGSKLKNYLFSIDVIMEDEIRSEINKAILRWEPRVSITDIQTKRKDERTFGIHITGIHVETLEPFTYEQIIRL
jgi:uncharacterized protein